MKNTDKPFNAALAAKKLLREGRSGALASLIPPKGDPYCSLVNVATAIDGAPLMLLSTLAIHTKNILADSRVSLMLDERKAGDPLEGARVMLMGSCSENGEFLGPSSLPQAPARGGNVRELCRFRRLPDRDRQSASGRRLRPHRRFGPARNPHRHFRRGRADRRRGRSDRAHERRPHGRAAPLRDQTARRDGRRLGSASASIRKASNCRQGRTALRLTFPQRVTGPGPLRAMLKALADKARAM